jgi:hypothetical protein
VVRSPLILLLEDDRLDVVEPDPATVGSPSEEFGIPVDEEGLAGRECDLVDPEGNRLCVATRRA